MRTTIRFVCKQLLVRTWIHYWSEGKWLVLYPCALSHFPPRSLGKILYPFEISREKREIDHSPLGTVYLLSSPAGALSYPNWDEDAHLSLSPPMHRKSGASCRYYKRLITPLLYSWLTVVKSICALGRFWTSTGQLSDQYWLPSPPL